ncbi:MAG: helix-turn-helix domain-containing protein [Oscillospiraceae bacterium]|nr:helix-turn-helix domain-containing protein [Oscillospiraceae bacterium]
MTFGEKLKDARQKAGLSQEQFSEKLHVSRSAVAKWETDKGMPDIGNLKATAQLLNVSIDYLLDDSDMLAAQTFKEPISREDYQKSGKCRSWQDAAVLAKFPKATQIYPLIRKKKLSKLENILEWTLLPSFGIFQAVDQINSGCAFYLAEEGDRQFFIAVSKEFIEYSALAARVNDKKFEVGNYIYQKANYVLI